MPDCPARLFRLFIVYQELTESFSSAASRRDEPAGGRDSCTTSSLSQIFQCSIFKTEPCRVAAASLFRKSPAKLRRKSEPAKFLTNFFFKEPELPDCGRRLHLQGLRPASLPESGCKITHSCTHLQIFRALFSANFRNHQTKNTPNNHITRCNTIYRNRMAMPNFFVGILS